MVLNFLLSLLPEKYADAVRRLHAAGFSPAVIVALVIEHRDAILGLIDKIIDTLGGLIRHEGGGECCPKLAKHLCATQCALLKAVWENHLAMHEAGCRNDPPAD